MERVRAAPGAGDDTSAPADETAALRKAEPSVAAPVRAAPNAPLSSGGACVSCGLHATDDICAHCGCALTAGDYRIVRVLAQSERGRVYEAGRVDGQRVALKELVFSIVPGAQQLEQFHREARVLRQLEHPCIPRYVDAFQIGAGVHTRLFLAQQFVEGQSLLARLSTHRFDEAEAKQLAIQILRILDYLHGLSPRLIHRDLKPSNLILRPGGEVALVDFDTARDLRAQRTHGASLAGTFGYVPIEQLGGTVDATSDLYALGATLIHLLSRKAPHELLTADLRLEFSREVNLSPGFTSWLQRLVAREPAARFQSVREAEIALGRSGRAAPVSKDEVASTPVVESRGLARPAREAYLKGEALGDALRSLFSVPGAVVAIVAMAALFLSSPRSATSPAQSPMTPVVAKPDLKPSPAPPRQQPPAAWHWLKLPQEVWNARFGRVTLRGGNYTLMGNAPEIRIAVSIDPSVEPAFDIRQLGARLLLANGQTVEATKLRLNPYNLGPDSTASLLELSFRLQPGTTLPIVLVMGDNTRIPLDLTLEVQ